MIMKSALAKARDEWLNSEEGKRCCEGTTEGQYLQNRLVLAFLEGWKFSDERIKELEERLEWHREETLRLEAELHKYREQALKGDQ